MSGGAIRTARNHGQAILSGLTIDATGDGDILASAGAEFDSVTDHSVRSSMLAVVFRLGDVDYRKYGNFRHSEPEEFRAVMAEIRAASGFQMLPLAAHRDDQVWVNNWVPGYDCVKVEDLTAAEIQVRKAMRKPTKFLGRKCLASTEALSSIRLRRLARAAADGLSENILLRRATCGEASSIKIP